MLMKIRSLLQLKAGIALCEVIEIETDPIFTMKSIGFEIVGPDGVIGSIHATLTEAQVAFDEITGVPELPSTPSTSKPARP